MPELLYSEVIEVNERVVLKQRNCELNRPCTLETGVTGEQVSHNLYYYCILNLPLSFCQTWTCCSSSAGSCDLSAPVFCRPLVMENYPSVFEQHASAIIVWEEWLHAPE